MLRFKGKIGTYSSLHRRLMHARMQGLAMTRSLNHEPPENPEKLAPFIIPLSEQPRLHFNPFTSNPSRS